MKMKITTTAHNNIIGFTTDVGKGVGYLKSLWKIEIDDPYVELDIDTSLEVGNNVRIVSEQNAFIRNNGNRNEILGIVEHIEDDGLVILRLSKDCLLMLEIKSVQQPLKTGYHLLLSVDARDLILT